MKKLKKLAALVLASAMVLTMGMTSFAAEPQGGITIKGTTAGKTLDAYRMFTAVNTGTNSGGETTVDYTLEEEFKEFFTSDVKYGCIGKTETALSEAAVDYVSKIQRGTAEGKVGFAKEVLAWIISKEKADTEKTYFSNVKLTTTTSKDTTTLSNVPYGLYVIYPRGASDTTNVTGDEKSPAMIVTVAETTPVAINMKSTYPTVDKNIVPDDTVNGDPDYVVDSDGGISIDDSWINPDLSIESIPSPDEPGLYSADPKAVTAASPAGDFNIGDEVTFQLESTVPDMTGFTSYTFKFVDTLSKGLSLKNVMQVKVGDTELKPEGKGTPAYKASLSSQTLTIELLDFFSQFKGHVGEEIVVTYTAVLNKDAFTGMDPNTNEAEIVFSNDPTTNTTGESEPDKVYVHTFDFDIFKFAKGEDAAETPLAGAEFELYGKYDNGTYSDQIKLVRENDNTWRVATDEETSYANTIKTPASGKVTVEGLAAGTYYLKETVAPDGYHKLNAPVIITIKPSYNEDTKELDSYTVEYSYNGTTLTDTEDNDTNADTPVVKVENKDGTILPDTGGMGTVIFTVAGLVLIIGVGASFVVSRRKRDAR